MTEEIQNQIKTLDRLELTELLMWIEDLLENGLKSGHRNLPKKDPKADWEESFDYLTDSDNFRKGKYERLEGKHLFDPVWYPESAYE